MLFSLLVKWTATRYLIVGLMVFRPALKLCTTKVNAKGQDGPYMSPGSYNVS